MSGDIGGNGRQPDDWVAAVRRLPKLELHCHLDACLRLETAADIGRDLGMPLPRPLRDALVAPEEACADLGDYLTRITLAVQLLQRPQDLRRVARELAEDMALDGVVYAEVRFAPQLHTRLGLGLAEILDAVHQGLQDGQRAHGVALRLIVCTLRHEAPETSLEVARVAAAHPDKVCALDLAGDEGRFPDCAPHAPAFAVAREAGLHLTAHAGENGGAPNVRGALDLLGVRRVGHGVRVEEDPDLVARLVHEGVSLDMCPRSNVQTRAVDGLAAHPIDRLLRNGATVTVSTDGRTVSGTTVTQELLRLREQFGWGLEEFRACQRNAARVAFAPPELRSDLLRRIDAVGR
jgi:adenosine deaminase